MGTEALRGGLDYIEDFVPVRSSEVRWAGDFQGGGEGGRMKGKGLSIYLFIYLFMCPKFGHPVHLPVKLKNEFFHGKNNLANIWNEPLVLKQF